MTLLDPTNQRTVVMAYPAELFDQLINGYAWAMGFKEDGQEIGAEAFPAAYQHPSYHPDRRTWKPTKLELVQAAIVVEISRKAAGGLVAKAQEDAREAEQTKQDALIKEVVGGGHVTLTPQA